MRSTFQTRPAMIGFLAIVIALNSAGCSELLQVENPGSVEAEDLNDPALAATLTGSAIGHFECAFSSYIVSAAMLSNEFVNASGYSPVHPWGWHGEEIRTSTGECATTRPAVNLGAFAALGQARYVAEEAARLITAMPAELPRKSDLLGQLAAYAGFSYVLLSEGFCQVTVDGGPAITRRAAAAIAEERFNTAITHATAANNTNLRLLAIAGRARTRLNMGNFEGAATDAAQIPKGFRWNANYSTTDATRENRIFNVNHLAVAISVNPVDYGPTGTRMRLGSAQDPRVPVTNSGRVGHDGATQLWLQMKYPRANTPIAMASWEEAQLILAEARPAEAAVAINALRAAQSLQAYTPTADLKADIIEERRRQLFLEGHRLNDILRHNLPFPTGLNNKGQPYGVATCMPLPDQERQNNPNLPK